VCRRSRLLVWSMSVGTSNRKVLGLDVSYPQLCPELYVQSGSYSVDEVRCRFKVKLRLR
jgi:hypothetical protein